MKVKIEGVSEHKELKFPCLMEHNGLIVLATEIKGRDMTGIVVSELRLYNTGVYAKNWHAPSFKPFNGTVTLQND